MKKSQISIFVIIGLIIIIIVGTLILLKTEKKDTAFDLEKIKSGTANIDQDFLENYVEHCTEITTIEAEKRFGLNRASSAAPIAAYISSQLPVCLEEFEIFKKQNFEVEYDLPEVTVSITSNALIADVIFPIKLTKGRLTLTFDKTSYTFPRTVTEEIDLKKTTTIRSTDKSFVIEIEPGTKAYLDGVEVKEVGMKQLDKNFNGLSNSVVAGMMAINGVPHGVEFSKPVKITKYYEDYEVPPFIKEGNMKIGYYHDKAGFWVGLPTEVDAVNNKLTVYTDHFSVYGSVVNCGGGDDPVTQIITPNLITQVCNDCNGWYYDEGNTQGFGELYKDSGSITVDTDYTSARLSSNSVIPGEEETPAPLPDQGNGKLWKDYTLDNCIKENNNFDAETMISSQSSYSTGYYLDQKEVVSCEESSKGISAIEFVGDLAVNHNLAQTNPHAVNVYVEFKNNDMYQELINNLKEDTYLVKEHFKEINDVCIDTEGEDQNCFGTCVKAGEFTTSIAQDLFPDISAEDPVYICVGDYYAYPLVENLKGRAIYSIEFEGEGDSCFALKEDRPEPGIETGLGDGENLPVGENVCPLYVDENGIIVGDSDLPPLTIFLKPMCLEGDECYITEYNLYQLPSVDNKVILWFIVETTNGIGDEGPDACIESNVAIEFKGKGAPEGSYNLLCNDLNMGKIDYVQGECKQCLENPDFCKNDNTCNPDTVVDKKGNRKYSWQDVEGFDDEACIFLDSKRCPASLIGKLFNTNGQCKECVALAGDIYYGEWIPSEGCESCAGGLSGPSSAETGLDGGDQP